VRDRRETVEALLDLRRGPVPAAESLPDQKAERERAPALRRYHNE
jgi:hypothetical protein